MLCHKQTKLAWSLCVLTLLQFVYSIGVVDARSIVGPSVEYGKFSYLMRSAYLMHLNGSTETDLLEQVIEKSNSDNPPFEFIYGRYTHAVVYDRGRAQMLVGRVDDAITTFEKLITNMPSNPDRSVILIHYFGDMPFLWNPFERGLLELGLAYDKTGHHAKADATYQKLITHPKFSEGLQARLAREILLLNITDRIGEIPSEHEAWIGTPAPHFGVMDALKEKFYGSHQYRGKVMLLYFGKTDALHLKPIHEKHKDNQFQIISVNIKQQNPQLTQDTVKNTDGWLHYNEKDGKLIETFAVRSIPSVFLIDSEGIVRRTHIRDTDLEKAINEMVSENLKTYHDPRTKKIITQTLTAHGGLENISAIKNFVVNVMSVTHMPYPIHQEEIRKEVTQTCYYYRDKYRIGYFVFDGRTFYRNASDKEWDLAQHGDKQKNTDYGNNVLFRQPIWLLQTLAENKIPIQYVGTQTVNGKPTSVLRVQQPNAYPLKIFIHENKHTLVQLMFVDIRNKQSSTIAFNHYKEVDGIKIPYFTKEGFYEEHVIQDITFNAEIDPKYFQVK